MSLMDWFNSVWQNSGLAPLWDTVAPWLALDERQLIFMVVHGCGPATPAR